MGKGSRGQYGQLSENQLIFQQINRINNLSSTLQGLEAEDWGILINRLELAVRSLRAMMTPLLDDEYHELKTELDKQYKQTPDEQQRTQNNDTLDIWAKQDYYMRLYSILIDTLYRNSLFYKVNADFSIEEDEQLKIDGKPLSEYEEITEEKKKRIKDGGMA